MTNQRRYPNPGERVTVILFRGHSQETRQRVTVDRVDHSRTTPIWIRPDHAPERCLGYTRDDIILDDDTVAT